jgi:hypothetical protein
MLCVYERAGEWLCPFILISLDPMLIPFAAAHRILNAQDNGITVVNSGYPTSAHVRQSNFRFSSSAWSCVASLFSIFHLQI